MQNKYLIISAYLTALVLSFIYGMLVVKFKYPPYKILQFIYSNVIINEEIPDKFIKLNPDYLLTDVSSLIQIKNVDDILDTRSRLIHYIWGKDGFPFSKMPAEIENNYRDDRYADLNNLKSIQKIVVSIGYGVDSIIYHFHPIQSKNQVILYHQGHNGDFIFGRSTIQYFLKTGYSVLAFSMPLLGMNSTPTVNLERFGRVKIEEHSRIQYLEHPIKYFLEPIAVTLNFIKKEFRYDDSIYMTGISGGGWTTVLYTAIDPRITKSYPVAGSLPLFLRNTQDWGDFEQNHPDLYQIANYLELYIIGSFGKGRKQLQIINQFDPSAFFGLRYKTYEKKVRSIVESLGNGEFEIYVDKTHKSHKISEHALKVIMKDINEIN